MTSRIDGGDPHALDEERSLAPPWTFWLALVPGALMVAYGIRGLLAATDAEALWSAVRWFLGGNLVQDLVVSPLACVVGYVLGRRLPPLARGPVQAAFVSCGMLGVVAYPFVRGYGRTPGEPSFLDRDYGESLLVLWACVWVVALAVVAWRALRRRGG